jgi:hypothetical protein
MSASRDHDDRLQQVGVRMNGRHYSHHGDDGHPYCRHEMDEHYHFVYAGDCFQPNEKNSGDHHVVIVLLIDSYIIVSEAKRAP